MGKIKDIIYEMLYPNEIKCIVCDNEMPYKNKYELCTNCALERNMKYCNKCGTAIDSMAIYCDKCMNSNRAFDEARAPIVYTDSAKKIIYKLKYGNGAYLAKILANYLADKYYETNWVADYIVYAPMHKQRKKERGYNQAEKLAKETAKLINLEVLKNILIKEKSTINLAKLNSNDREKMIANTITIDNTIDIKDKNILLIDDVFTTGATSNECSKVLKSGGAAKVFVLTFATGRFKPLLY